MRNYMKLITALINIIYIHHLNACVLEDFLNVFINARCCHALWIRARDVTTYRTVRSPTTFINCTRSLNMYVTVNHYTPTNAKSPRSFEGPTITVILKHLTHEKLNSIQFLVFQSTCLLLVDLSHLTVHNHLLYHISH